jgi:hypothetical protein
MLLCHFFHPSAIGNSQGRSNDFLLGCNIYSHYPSYKSETDIIIADILKNMGNA